MTPNRKWILIILSLSFLLSATLGIVGVTVYWNRDKTPKKNRLKPIAIGEPRLGVQLGHSEEVRAVAFSHDGKLVVTGSGDHTAILWDVATGKEIRRFLGHTAGINAVSFSPDDRFVLTGSGQIDLYTDNLSGALTDDPSARVWDVTTGKELLQVREDIGICITSVAFSPDGKFILTGSHVPSYEGGIFSLWSAETGKKIRPFRYSSEGSSIKSSIAFSPDGHSVLLGFEAGNAGDGVQLWDVDSGKRIHKFTNAEFATFSPDGQRILMSNGDILDSKTWVLIQQISTTPLFNCIFSPDGQYVVSRKSLNNSEQRQISPDPDDLDMTVRNVSTGQQVLSIYNPPSSSAQSTDVPTSPAIFSPDSKYILTGWWNWTSRLQSIAGDGEERVFKGQVRGYEGKFSPDGKYILTGNEMWDLTNGKQIHRFFKIAETSYYNNSYYDNHIVFSPNGQYAFKLSLKQGILFDLGMRQEIRQFSFDGKQSFGPIFSPDSRFILTVDGANNVNLCNISTGERVRVLQQGVDDIGIFSAAAVMSPNGKYIFSQTLGQTSDSLEPDESTSEQYGIGLFSIDSGELIKPFLLKSDDEFDFVTSANFSPDGKFVLAGCDDGMTNGNFHNGMAILWNVDTGKEVRRFIGHSGGIFDLAFSPDGQFIITAGEDRFVILWNVVTGQIIRKFESPLANGTSVSFSPDGRFILTGSQDGAMAIWDFATGQELCRLISFENGDWVVTTPEGRFDTNNLDNITGLHWILSSEPLKPLPLDIFMRQYYEPRLLARVLAGEKLKPLPSLTELNRTQPKVQITDISFDSTETVKVTIEVANVQSATQKDINDNSIESGVFDVRLFRDGQLVGYAPTDNPEEKSDSIWSKIVSTFTSTSVNDGEVELNKDGKAILTFSKIKLPRTGVEQIEFSTYAFNNDRIKSATDRKTYTITPKLASVKGRAYVVSVGVNAYEREGLNLRYAANDAQQVQNTLVYSLASQGKYEEIIGIPLVSDYEVTLADGYTVPAQDGTLQQVHDGKKRITENRATKAHLRAVLDALAGRGANTDLLKAIPNADKLRPARPEDLVLLSVSSHGYTDSDGIFYIVPSDTGTASVSSSEFRAHCVSSDELSHWLRDVDAGELVMIVDACHSAAAVEGTEFKPGPMGSRGLGQLSYDKGMRILTATQADNVALETNKVRQGLLIYALLQDGLSAWRADYKPQDKSIMLSEWLNYGVERVPRLYAEVKDGRIRSVRETNDLLESEDKIQQPSLFDFARQQRELVLARQP